MKVLWLLKRRYMAKDLIADRYGRYHALPTALARHGIRSEVVALDYRPGRTIDREEDGVRWRAGSWSRGYASLLAEVARGEYDGVVGGLDAIYCALAARFRRPFVLDLSDDYEAYASACIPGVVPIYRRALRDAAGVACISPTLTAKARRLGARAECFGNATDARFTPRPKPDGPPTFGYLGALHPNRGLATLWAAWPRVRARLPDARLILAGPLHRRVRPPRLPGVDYLGHLPHAAIPDLLRTLDVSLVLTLPNRFGRHCDPVKLVEARACGVRVVVACGAGAEELATEMIAAPAQPPPPAETILWDDLAVRYAAFLRDAFQ